jgi:predicted nucleotidyltransferase
MEGREDFFIIACSGFDLEQLASPHCMATASAPQKRMVQSEGFMDKQFVGVEKMKNAAFFVFLSRVSQIYKKRVRQCEQMNKVTIIPLLEQFFRTQPVQRAWLFGSVVRGEATEQSDIDVLVELDMNEKISLLRFIVMQQDLEGLLQRPVDLVSEGGVSKYIKPFIDNEKQLIYERHTK